MDTNGTICWRYGFDSLPSTLFRLSDIDRDCGHGHETWIVDGGGLNTVGARSMRPSPPSVWGLLVVILPATLELINSVGEHIHVRPWLLQSFGYSRHQQEGQVRSTLVVDQIIIACRERTTQQIISSAVRSWQLVYNCYYCTDSKDHGQQVSKLPQVETLDSPNLSHLYRYAGLVPR